MAFKGSASVHELRFTTLYQLVHVLTYLFRRVQGIKIKKGKRSLVFFCFLLFGRVSDTRGERDDVFTHFRNG
jgi:hypothetical protein